MVNTNVISDREETILEFIERTERVFGLEKFDIDKSTGRELFGYMSKLSSLWAKQLKE